MSTVTLCYEKMGTKKIEKTEISIGVAHGFLNHLEGTLWIDGLDEELSQRLLRFLNTLEEEDSRSGR